MNIELLYDKECIICLDNKETEWITLECRHEYHKKCIYDWMRVRMICPICIRVIRPPHREEIVEHVSDAGNVVAHTCCSRRIPPVICSMIFLSFLCILVGCIIIIYKL